MCVALRTTEPVFSAHFGSRIRPESTVGALLAPPFRTVSEEMFSEV
jgi:hypothetical protein